MWPCQELEDAERDRGTRGDREGPNGAAGDVASLMNVKREVTYQHFVGSMWRKITGECNGVCTV